MTHRTHLFAASLFFAVAGLTTGEILASPVPRTSPTLCQMNAIINGNTLTCDVDCAPPPDPEYCLIRYTLGPMTPHGDPTTRTGYCGCSDNEPLSAECSAKIDQTWNGNAWVTDAAHCYGNCGPGTTCSEDAATSKCRCS